jgi:hypothetical protein
MTKKRKEIHPNHPMMQNPAFATQIFNRWSKPDAWLRIGRHLRTSADILLEREDPIATRHWGELRRIGAAHIVAGGNAQPEDYDELKFPFPNFNVAYMLVAYALENLLKGLAVAKGRVVFSGQELPKDLMTHDLSKLHALATPSATADRHVLDSLTYMSEWRARYPLPSSVEKIWPMGDNGAPKAAGLRWPESHQEFLAYCDGLETELRGLI